MKNVVLVLITLLWLPLAAQKRPLTFTDIMKFQQLRNPVISEKGGWVGYDAWPDRGDGEAVIQNTRTNARRFVIPLGQKPVISADEKWAAAATKPSLADEETAKRKKTKAYGNVVLINLETGVTEQFKYGRTFAFSPDGKKIWVHFNTPDSLDKVYKKSKKTVGSRLLVRDLSSAGQREWPFGFSAAFDSLSGSFAYSIADTSGANSLRLASAAGFVKDSVIHAKKNAIYEKLSWHFKSGKLAFTVADQEKDGKYLKADLHVWPPQKGSETILSSSVRFRSGWIIPAKAGLDWTNDGKNLIFGIRPEVFKKSNYSDSTFTEKDYYDQSRMLTAIEGDLWHHAESKIKTHEKKVKDRWKTQFFSAVYNLDQQVYTVLSDTFMTGTRWLKNAPVALQWTEIPNAGSYVWEGTSVDAFVVDYIKGVRTPVAEKLQSPPQLSPDGKFLVFWKSPDWFLFEVSTKAVTNLTRGMPVRFADEDHDMPSEAPPYGFAGWTPGSAGVLLYDRYDMWLFSTKDGGPTNTTVIGRKNLLEFRLKKTDDKFETISDTRVQYLHARHETKKHTGIYTVILKKPGATRLVEEPRKYTLLSRVEGSGTVMYSIQSYTEFPDLWVAGPSLKKPVRITALNPVVKDIAWGAAELVSYTSLGGKPLQGILIKPDNFAPGRPVPVLVYFYEIMSNRMYDFPAVNVDTRPDFAQFASDGYAVFLPDIVYKLDGDPMNSAYECILPGIRKIIEMGVADSTAIGLHGHSWGGTQTTYLITRTNMFKAAIAGAPVTNWVSAYSGIRWQSGLARQFQYEQSQSRIGASFWDKPDLYFKNSALWEANNVETPLLLQHGDADGAVPWYQSIEFFLALKRLGKPVWFLQYFGEDHHLAKYPNKLDYAIKFKEFFDFYLKGAPEPEWMKTGIPYRPKD